MTCRAPIFFTTTSWWKTSTRLVGRVWRICGKSARRSYSAIDGRFPRIRDVDDVDVAARPGCRPSPRMPAAPRPRRRRCGCRAPASCSAHRHSCGRRTPPPACGAATGWRRRRGSGRRAGSSAIAGLVVRHEQVALERGRVHMERLHALAGIAPRRRGTNPAFLGRAGSRRSTMWMPLSVQSRRPTSRGTRSRRRRATSAIRLRGARLSPSVETSSTFDCVAWRCPVVPACLWLWCCTTGAARRAPSPTCWRPSSLGRSCATVAPTAATRAGRPSASSTPDRLEISRTLRPVRVTSSSRRYGEPSALFRE